MTIQDLILNGQLRCVDCSNTVMDFSGPQLISCSCGKRYTIENQILFTFPELLDERSTGFMAKTFARPSLYRKLIDLKWNTMGALGIHDKMLGISELVMNQSVLELGCGPDLDLPSTELNLDFLKSYVGLDFSSSFVRSARVQNPVSSFDFVQADAGNLPFEDDSFDVVIAAFTIHHVPHDPQQVVDEMFRVARHTVIIFDHIKSDSSLVGWLQMFYWRVLDGGHHYQTQQLWSRTLRDRIPSASLRTGALGKHVIKMAFQKVLPS